MLYSNDLLAHAGAKRRCVIYNFDLVHAAGDESVVWPLCLMHEVPSVGFAHKPYLDAECRNGKSDLQSYSVLPEKHAVSEYGRIRSCVRRFEMRFSLEMKFSFSFVTLLSDRMLCNCTSVAFQAQMELPVQGAFDANRVSRAGRRHLYQIQLSVPAGACFECFLSLTSPYFFSGFYNVLRSKTTSCCHCSCMEPRVHCTYIPIGLRSL